ncbi:glucuronate isomerase [Frankia sp. CNm7]|uniref:Uronate isomerase n=1 Tax=Frankia nepalensis TaxID=1836974 RepID=A0A937UV74_9ACTN|nr:glucuronate isomerase [Frankia nepalensis]MBL7497356.1 glucuronate isomerase [Frankia nepalensis]MBL7510930.1 glucuronate isomerase [Frankia nepalensis]MBL7517268.1 glucuronate isomerase [Frankia nepalensis]MBL7631951.1 glucuronate isomerase [Frankia nepalensis]
MSVSAGLVRHPDRLLPVEPSVRAIARRLYGSVRDLPIVSPHGHVDARLLADDAPFPDPSALLVTPDHYVTRLLHASGVPLGDLGVGRGPLPEEESRRVWRRVCARWHVFRGTPVRYWLEAELAEVFDVQERPTAENADAIYDQVATCLAKDTYRPRGLFERFGIEVLATTDDPCDDLAPHARLAADPAFTGRVLPAFRPDRYLEATRPDWLAAVARLGEVADTDTGSYRGWVAAMEQRRAYFVRHGATSTDHSHDDVGTEPLAAAEAERIYRAALTGNATAREGAALRRHMLLEMARMSCDDGLTMMLHPAVRRGHHRPTLTAYGPDTGHDIPIRVEFTDALRPLLERFGTHPNLRLVLFTLDETTYSRELAPLAGFYPSVYLGAPWWFLDAPDAVLRFRAAVTETTGFTRTAGFIDDARGFCSIPVRHDMARRLDSGFLARLVAEHRLDEDEALDVLADLVTGRPRAVFRL